MKTKAFIITLVLYFASLLSVGVWMNDVGYQNGLANGLLDNLNISEMFNSVCKELGGESFRGTSSRHCIVPKETIKILDKKKTCDEAGGKLKKEALRHYEGQGTTGSLWISSDEKFSVDNIYISCTKEITTTQDGVTLTGTKTLFNYSF